MKKVVKQIGQVKLMSWYSALNRTTYYYISNEYTGKNSGTFCKGQYEEALEEVNKEAAANEASLAFWGRCD